MAPQPTAQVSAAGEVTESPVGQSMRRGTGVRPFVACLLAVAVLAAVAAPAGTAKRRPVEPVPSLEPAKTQALWTKLVEARERQRLAPTTTTAQASASCKPARVVFYAATDWLRLATKLAATASPCADYYISIPPLAADKTAFRTEQAWKIRALGPRFHAVAEVSYTGWSGWVASTGHTWFEAGLEARRRLAAAGYDVASGDLWSLNELSSAVRRGDGDARLNARELARGLYQGDGSAPTRGIVFTAGIAQSTANLSTYKSNLQGWLADAPFWTDMAAYVSDWSQEVYGDVRNYAVAGAGAAARRDALNEYLQHELRLANAGPGSAAAARSFLQGAHSPLANAAWAWDSAFGWTAVTTPLMQDYVSAQIYAARWHDAARSLDRFGFAWSPKNLWSAPTAEYNAQTAAILDRLAAAIRDSGEPLAPGDPGAGACGADGAWCSASLDGAAFTTAWQTLASWPVPALTLIAASSVAAGATTGLTVELRESGTAVAAAEPLVVSLASSSARGSFAPTAAGPWSPTITVTIPAGASSTTFAYRDTAAGEAVLTAGADAAQQGAATIAVAAGALAALSLDPDAVTVVAGSSLRFAVSGADAWGNAVAVSPTWSLGSGTPGTLTGDGATATFTAGPALGSGTVLVSAGGLSRTASVTVVQRLSVPSVTFARLPDGRLAVTVTVVDASGARVVGATVALTLYRDKIVYATGSGQTGSHGGFTFTTAPGTPSGCYTAVIASLAAGTAVWDGLAPRSRFCG